MSPYVLGLFAILSFHHVRRVESIIVIADLNYYDSSLGAGHIATLDCVRFWLRRSR
jgi:hypothetical protein